MVSESKTGVCKYCSSPYHRGWQCPQRPKKEKKSKTKPSFDKKGTIKKFDEVYSRYTRLSQVAKTGHCRCFICGKRLNYESACIGHFISRRYLSTRFDPVNANVICYQCNMIDSNENLVLELYAKRIEEEYGLSELNRILNKKNKKITNIELYSLFESYKEKLKELDKVSKQLMNDS